MKEFEEYAKKMLTASLDKIILHRTMWMRDGCGLGIDGAHLEEMLHHCKWAREKVLSFVGRETLVNNALRIIANSTSESTKNARDKYYAGISLAVIGKSGTGKTSIMAKLANMLFEKEEKKSSSKHDQESIPIIVRFCGTSRRSSDGYSLIVSICRQIQLVSVDGDGTGSNGGAQQEPGTYAVAVELLQRLLNEYPVILLIDSLDQLSDENLARSKVSFLRGLIPHRNTRVIVSMLPDDKSGKASGKNELLFYGSESTLMSAKVPKFVIPDFSTKDHHSDDSVQEECRHIVRSLLARHSRKLTVKQLDYVMSRVAVEPTALYMNLASIVTSKWHCDASIDDLNLQGGVVNIVDQIFEDLEKEFGILLAQTALSFITWSREGISDAEMVDLLSLDDDVLKRVFQYSSPGITKLPPHVWLRLRDQLKQLIVLRNNGCFQWYHRQIWNSARIRYSQTQQRKKILHATMGRYFSDIVDARIAKKRFIAHQPISMVKSRMIPLNLGFATSAKANSVYDFGVWTAKPLEINDRRAAEGSFHLIEAGLFEQAGRELCLLESLCGRLKMDRVFESVALLSKLLNHLKSSDSGAKGLARVESYYRWLLQDASMLNARPNGLIASCSSQPMSSVARQEIEQLLKATSGGVRRITAADEHSWIRCRAMGGRIDFDSLLGAFQGHTAAIRSVCCHGSRIISGSLDRTVRIWDSVTGETVSVLEGHTGEIWSVDINHDGSTIASASDDKTVKLWDSKTGILRMELKLHTAGVMCIRFSKDGKKLVSASGDKMCRVWDASTGDSIFPLIGHTGVVWAACFNDAGTKIASGSLDKSIRLWKASNGSLISTLLGHTKEVRCVAFSPGAGDFLASGSEDMTARVWDITSGLMMAELIGHTNAVRAIVYSPDGTRIFTGSSDTTAKLWDAKSGVVLLTMDGYSLGWVMGGCFTTDGRYLITGGGDKMVRVWDVDINDFSQKSPRAHVQGHSGSVSCVIVSPDGKKLVSTSEDKTIIIWDVASGSILSTLLGHTSMIWSVCFSPDGKKIASAGDHTVRVWDFFTQQCLHVCEGHSGEVTSVCFNYDGSHVVSGSWDKTLRTWDISTRTCNPLITMEGHSALVRCVQYSPSGEKVVSGSKDRTVRVWNAETGSVLQIFDCHNKYISSVSYSANGESILTSSGDKTNPVLILDAKHGKIMSAFKSLVGDTVHCAAYSPDGSKIVVGLASGGVRVLDVKTGHISFTLDGHTSWIMSARFSPDGTKIVTGSHDRTVRVWEAVTVSGW